MNTEEFRLYIASILKTTERIQLQNNSRILIISDLHLGDGSSRDDSIHNYPLIMKALRDYYLPRGFLLVLNGDIEELQKFKLSAIRAAHPEIYEVFDAFAAKKHFRKLVGNHDSELLEGPHAPYPLHEALRLDHPEGTLLCYHGHQPSEYYVRFHGLTHFLVRYLGRPLGIKNRDRAMTNKRRRKVERQAYLVSRSLGIASIIGHTHRPLFESFSKYDQLRFKLETLISTYAQDKVSDPRQEEEIRFLAAEVRKIVRKKERRGTASLYDTDGVPVPCLFNSGCSTGKSGITCIEISGERISLVLWSEAGRVKTWIEREALDKSPLGEESGAPLRYILRSDEIGAVFTRIRLLSTA